MEQTDQKTTTTVTTINDTFVMFGDNSYLLNANKELKPIIDVIDFISMSLEEICNKAQVDIIKIEEVIVNKENILLVNKYHTFYNGARNSEEVSVLILNNLNENKQDFGNLLLKIKKLSNI